MGLPSRDQKYKLEQLTLLHFIHSNFLLKTCLIKMIDHTCDASYVPNAGIEFCNVNKNNQNDVIEVPFDSN